MAPPVGSKRKRGDRSYSGDNFDGTRPSPHRPGNLNLAQQNQSSPNHGYRDVQEYRGRGGRRGNRGGVGRGTPRSPHQTPMGGHLQHRPQNTNSQPTVPSALQVQQNRDPPKQAEVNPVTVVTAASTQTPPPEDPPSFYAYEFLTDNIISTWGESGRSEIVQKGIELRKEQDILNLSIIFQELVKSAVDGKLSPEEVGSAVKQILQPDHDGDYDLSGQLNSSLSTFLDTFTMLAPSGNVKESQLSDRESAIFPRILLTCGVSWGKIAEELDLELLTQLKLVRPVAERRRVQYQTQVLYRQSNYNLLREESEGYSKLITELFTTSGNEPPSADVVSGTFERVKAMIGAFDLDVGRVLDITLDIFAAVLVRKYRFFVKYFRASTWWPQQPMFDKFRSSEMCFRTLPAWALPQNTGFENWNDEEKEQLQELKVQRDTKFWNRVREIGIEAFFELGGRKVTPEDVDLESEASKTWIEATGVAPINGNVVAAQVLGFKLRFYSSPARSASDTLPPNLIYLAALLIKIGFITLQDLYPHLWPDDKDVQDVKEQKMKEKEEREKANRPGGAANNALAMAGALTDDTITPAPLNRQKDATAKPEAKDEQLDSSSALAEAKEELPEPSDQKVQLLKSLLCIGALPEALFMLGRFPWLPDAFPELPEHIHRILHHCISKIYEPLRPLSGDAAISSPHTIVDPDQSGVLKGNIRRIDQPPHKTLRWPLLDKFDSNERTNYVFYWDDWADNIPVCQTVDDVFALCNTLLAFSGVKIGNDPALLTKLARIGKHSHATDPSESNRARWVDLSKRLLVPALSLTKRIPGVIEEVWDLIKQFSTPVRFSIYAEWYHGTISRNQDIKVAFDQSRAETKDCLKRISKTNVRPMARLLAKIATCSPGVVFAVAIGQIESYDNLVDVVVECGRYFTFLGYDVLTWSLMNSLGNSKARVQADGMLTSLWLRALAEFSGKVFKRYSVMSPAPILQYVLYQLQRSNPTDLVVLEEIVSSMSGIVSDTDLNDAQIIAMAGGKHLQSQIMLQLLDRRHESSMKTTAKRLMKALVEPKLAGPLLVAIAQERQTCIFQIPEEDAHLKLLGNLYDKIHRVLVQYLDLLRSNLSINDFNELVPSLSELIGDFGLDPAAAFWISRPSLAAEVAENDERIAQEKAELAKMRKETRDSTTAIELDDVQMIDGETTTAEDANLESESLSESPTKGDTIDTDMKRDQTERSPEEVAATPGAVELDSPWHPVLQKTIAATRPLLPDDTFQVLSDTFYFTFWQMSLGDVFMPLSSYEVELDRIARKKVTIKSDRSDLSTRGTQKKQEEIDTQEALRAQLQTEMRDQIGLYQRGKSRLQKEKDFWFADCWGKWDALNVAIIEHCFLPRICLSPLDAMYTVKLLKLLHTLGTKYFRTVGLLDQFFNKDRLTSLFFLCTNREADNIGRFINEVLKDLARWHADKAVYEKEAHGAKGKSLPGFCVKFDEEKNPATMMDYEDFRRILYKWHTNLNNALKACFQGGEYMHIRNAIAMLKACTINFPLINWMGTAQVNLVTEISKSEKREDLKLAAKALLGHLKRRESTWVSVQSFMTASKTQAAGGKATPKSSTPQPEAGAKLNARAPEFKPRSPAPSDDFSKPAPLKTDKMEIEEGEVKSAGLVPENVDAAAMKPADLSQSRHAPEAAPEKEDPKQDDYLLEDTPLKDDHPLVKTGSSETSVLSYKIRDASSRQPSRPETRQDTRPSGLPNAPPRPVNGRSSSHNIPSRPEVAPRSEARTGRPQERHFTEDGRPGRYADHRRGGPSLDYPQRDHGYHNSGYGRHDRDGRDGVWPNDRRPHQDSRYDSQTPREERAPPRDDRPDRHSRDRPLSEYEAGRLSDTSGRLSRDGSMAPPRPTNTPHSERGTPRSAQEDRHIVHPDRRSEVPRQDDYPHPGSQRGSRGSSPTRADDWSRPTDYQYREERPPLDSRRPPDGRSSRSHYDESRLPSGPRGDRTPDNLPSNNQSERLRESFNSSNLGPTRYSQNDRSQQESSFGRLNADTPPGPRTNGGPATRGGRMSNASLPQVNTQPPAQNSMPSPAIPERQAPTGPASGRAQTRATSSAFNRSGPSSGPPTPSAESPDTAGVHPDRLKAIQGSETSQSPRSGNAPVAAPSGPRGPMTPQSSVPPASRPLPQYPLNERNLNDRSAADRSGRSDRRFAGVNSILQQPGQPVVPDRSNPGPAIRGRASRGPNMPPSPSSGGAPARKDTMISESPLSSRDAPALSRQDPYDNRGTHGPGYSSHREEERNTRDVERRSSGRHEARPESPRRHPGPPSSLPSGPPSRPPREDLRQNQRRIDEQPRSHDVRETRTRSGALPAAVAPERDLRRQPRDDAAQSGREMHREREGRRDSGRDDWGNERGPRERRDMGAERRDTGPPVDGGSYRRKRGAPEEGGYDPSKRNRR